MRGAVLGFAAGGLVLFAGPAYADGGLEVNPSDASPGQTIGISTGDNCRNNDGSATVSSGAFGTVQTSVSDGEADVAVSIRGNSKAKTYPIKLTCHPSNRTISGSVTVKKVSPKRCWQDDHGKWHGRCHHRGPETGFGGSMDGTNTPLAAAGVGILGAGAMVAAMTWLRRARA